MKLAFIRGWSNRPACQCARDFRNILLRVATVDSQSVEFHQFARIVLIDAWLAFRIGIVCAFPQRRLRNRSWRRRKVVIQIEEHGGALRRRQEKVFELAEYARPDHVHFEVRREPAVRSLVPVHVEVVEPEVGHDFLKLPLAIHAPNHSVRNQFLQKLLRPLQPVVHHVLLDLPSSCGFAPSGSWELQLAAFGAAF